MCEKLLDFFYCSLEDLHDMACLLPTPDVATTGFHERLLTKNDEKWQRIIAN